MELGVIVSVVVVLSKGFKPFMWDITWAAIWPRRCNHFSFFSIALQSVIFYAVQSPKLDQWLRSDVLREQLKSVHDPQYTDIDRVFYQNIDEDYDLRHGGISKTTYLNCYLAWIQYCALRKDPVSNEMLETTMQWKLLQKSKLFLLIFYSF